MAGPGASVSDSESHESDRTSPGSDLELRRPGGRIIPYYGTSIMIMMIIIAESARRRTRLTETRETVTVGPARGRPSRTLEFFQLQVTAWIADFFCRIASLKALLLVHIFRGL